MADPNPNPTAARQSAVGPRRRVLFAFVVALAVADLATKQWAVARLASPVHPMVWTDCAGKTPTELFAERGIDPSEGARLFARGAVARLERRAWRPDQTVGAADVGREIVATAATGFPAPRAVRLRSADVGRPIAAVAASAFRVDTDAVGPLIAGAWQATHGAVRAEERLAATDGLALFERSITVIDGLYQFVYAENPGAAFSFLTNAPPLVRHLLFSVLAAIATVAIGWWLWRRRAGSTLAAWALAAILGGAIGNLVDRQNYRVVIDFLYMYVTVDGKVHGWPVYNVADIGVTVGVVLLLFESLFRRPAAPAAAPPSS